MTKTIKSHCTTALWLIVFLALTPQQQWLNVAVMGVVVVVGFLAVAWIVFCIWETIFS